MNQTSVSLNGALTARSAAGASRERWGRLFRLLASLAGLLLSAGLAVHPAAAQSERYPPADEPWDGASYRALAQRVETEGLPLPALSDAATKPVFERMVKADNIPLRVGLNQSLSVTIRFQRLDSALQPIHRLAELYMGETQKGKAYGEEVAKMTAYEAKVSAAMLDLSDAYLATLAKDKRYQVHVDYIATVKSDARQLYVRLVRSIVDPRLHAKPDILSMISVAREALPSYRSLLTEQERRDLVGMLSQQISTAADQELKTAFTQLREAIEQRRT